MAQHQPDGPGVVLANKTGEPILPQDKLTLPDGRKLGAVERSELARVLINAGVPGIAHDAGKHINAEIYERFLASMTEQSGKAAFANWAQNAQGRTI